MHNLSAVIITHNEEKNIERCIRVLKLVADEIVIIDSFSSDNTAAICNHLNVRFLQKAWEGFGPQKRYGVQQTVFNNIIALDADEVLDEEAINEINKLKKNGFHAVYELKLFHYYFGKFLHHGQEYPNYKKRIFCKDVVEWNENKVHESLIIPENIPVIKLRGKINHYSYTSLEQYLTKSNLYTTIAARSLFEKGKKSYLLNMVFSPSFTFFKSYIINAGFLDGFHGFVVAMLNGYTNFLKYSKLWNLRKGNN